MNHSVITPSTAAPRFRGALVVGLLAALALGIGLAVAALTGSGSGSGSDPVATRAAAPAGGSSGSQLCAADYTNVLGAVVAMPATVGGRVVAELSPELSRFVESSVRFGRPSVVPAAPGAVALGETLAHLDVADRNAVMSGVPPDQQAAVAAAEKATALAITYGHALGCR